MQVTKDTRYRLRLAEGFLAEARRHREVQLWRARVSSSQLAAENAVKAVLSMLGPVGHTHSPAALLAEAIREKGFPEPLHAQVERLVRASQPLGQAIHVESDYGCEVTEQTPWEIFDEEPARRVLSLAEEAVSLAKEIIKEAGET